AWRTPVRPATAAAVADMMVWAAEQGGILAAGIPGVRVGGKTGTAETSVVDANNAWYIGFANDGTRNLAICVVVDGEGTGGTIALPIAHELMVAALAADLSSSPA
ncbi:MAG: penicillin-binding transpeptidase domain-containing protein, partial [Chloroflexota bacterium]